MKGSIAVENQSRWLSKLMLIHRFMLLCVLIASESIGILIVKPFFSCICLSVVKFVIPFGFVLFSFFSRFSECQRNVNKTFGFDEPKQKKKASDKVQSNRLWSGPKSMPIETDWFNELISWTARLFLLLYSETLYVIWFTNKYFGPMGMGFDQFRTEINDRRANDPRVSLFIHSRHGIL